MPDRLLTTVEVAEVLRVHPKHVYRLLKKGLPGRRVGGEWRFSREDVLAWSGGGRRDVPGSARAPRAEQEHSTPPSLVGANGDLVVRVLLRMAEALGPPLIGMVQMDMGAAVEHLQRRSILAAGVHAGGSQSHVGGERVARIHLVRREIGLVHPGGQGELRLKDLVKRKIASRPPSAGVRAHLDRALREEGLDPARIHRHAREYSSHLDVVLAVASGNADVGLASRAWGERAGLAFSRIATEDYGLLVQARDLGDPRVVRLCEVAQGTVFRREIGAIPGYEPAGSGDIRYDAQPSRS